MVEVLRELGEQRGLSGTVLMDFIEKTEGGKRGKE